MPVDYDMPDAPSCSLEEAAQALAESGFDARDPESAEAAATWLARLIANRSFLAELLIDRLAQHREHEIESGYGPQALVLTSVRSGMFLRANIWPAAKDWMVQTSGAESFVYGTAHDHNFAFLTGGYSGPGYVSDHYEYDYDKLTGYPGEKVELRHTGRSTLSQGAIQLYRAHRDVHVQHPPVSLSVSLNIIEVNPAQSWFDQYAFDVEGGRVLRLINSGASEIFLRAAVASGSAAAADFAEWVGRTHPSERLRLASFEARAGLSGDMGERDAVWRDAESCGSRLVSAIARERRLSEEA